QMSSREYAICNPIQIAIALKKVRTLDPLCHQFVSRPICRALASPNVSAQQASGLEVGLPSIEERRGPRFPCFPEIPFSCRCPQEQESARSDHSPAALPETIGNYWLLRKTILERFSPVYANCALSPLGVSMMDCPSAVSKVESPW